MVQPFAKDFEQRGQKILLCMQEMDSKHFAHPVRADEFSIDGIRWEIIPESINVLGSRYALVIENLHKENFGLPLGAMRVAVGNSIGSVGNRYIRGRVDKACLEVLSEPEEAAGGDPDERPISLIA
jgi:hypothetical protein